MLWTDALKTFLMSNVFFYHGICSHPSYHTVTSSLAWVGWGTPPKFAWPRTCPATKLYINGKSSMKSPAPDNYIMSLADFFESDAGSELWFSKLAAWLQIHTTIQFNQLFWVVFHWGLALLWVATCSHCGCQWFWGEIKQKIAYGHQSNYSKGFHFSSVPLIFPLSQVEVAKKNQDKEWALEVLQMQDIKPFEPVAAAQCSALALVEAAQVAAQGAAAATAVAAAQCSALALVEAAQVAAQGAAVAAAQCSALALLKAAQVAAQWAPADPVVAAQCFALALVEAAQVAAHWAATWAASTRASAEHWAAATVVQTRADYQGPATAAYSDSQAKASMSGQPAWCWWHCCPGGRQSRSRRGSEGESKRASHQEWLMTLSN